MLVWYRGRGRWEWLPWEMQAGKPIKAIQMRGNLAGQFEFPVTAANLFFSLWSVRWCFGSFLCVYPSLVGWRTPALLGRQIWFCLSQKPSWCQLKYLQGGSTSWRSATSIGRRNFCSLETIWESLRPQPWLNLVCSQLSLSVSLMNHAQGVSTSRESYGWHKYLFLYTRLKHSYFLYWEWPF